MLRVSSIPLRVMQSKVIVLPSIILLGVMFGYLLSSPGGLLQLLWLPLFAAICFWIIFGEFGLVISLVFLSTITRGALNIWGDITPWDILVLILFGKFLVFRLLVRKSVKPSVQKKVFIIFLILVVGMEILGVTVFPIQEFYNVSIKWFIQFLEFLFVMLYIGEKVKNARDVKKYVYLEVVCGVFLAAIIIYESIYGHIFVTGGGNPLFATTYSDLREQLKISPDLIRILTPALFLLYLTIRRRVVMIPTLLVIIYAIMISINRSQYLALGVGLLVLLSVRGLRKNVIFVASLAVIVFLSFNIFYPKVYGVFENVSSYFAGSIPQTETSTYGRLILWRAGGQMFLEHPFWGYGINTFGFELYSRPEYLEAPGAYYIFPHWSAATRAGTSHNDYLQVLVDFGLLGFGLFIYLLFSVIKRSYVNFKVAEDQFLKNSSLALFISLVSISAAFMGTSILYPVGTLLGVFFWYNIGLIIAIKKIVSGSSPAPDGTSVGGRG